MAGCSKENTPDNTVKMSLVVDISEATKSALDGDGNANNVNRCIVQIWDGNKIYKNIVQTAPKGTKQFEFHGIDLDPETVYDFLFWADCCGEAGSDLYWGTENLKRVRLKDETIGNTDALDAFCNCVKGILIHEDHVKRITLRRPLAQFNAICLDLPDIAGMPGYENFKPATVSYTYFACTAFNVYTDEYVGNGKTITVTDVPVYASQKDKDGNPAERCTLAMNYLFPYDGEAVESIEMTVTSINGAEVVSKFDNIPLKRNYRTNIIGKILTNSLEVSVDINPFFNSPDIPVEGTL